MALGKRRSGKGLKNSAEVLEYDIEASATLKWQLSSLLQHGAPETGSRIAKIWVSFTNIYIDNNDNNSGEDMPRASLVLQPLDLLTFLVTAHQLAPSISFP